MQSLQYEEKTVTSVSNVIVKTLATRDLSHRRTALLIRHGEREMIAPGTFGIDVGLTHFGVNKSLELGKSLKHIHAAIHLYTSPVQRCVRTAEAIATGAERHMKIDKEDNLGNPGFHIFNAELAGEYYLRYGTIGVFDKFVAGEDVPGIASISYLKNEASRWIDDKCVENGLSIFITHDSLIAHYAFAAGIRAYSASDWVDFLDGVMITFPSKV